MSESPVVLILAYNGHEAREMMRRSRKRAKENNQPIPVFVNGKDTERIRGLTFDRVQAGSMFWERDDALELARIAQNHLKDNAKGLDN